MKKTPISTSWLTRERLNNEVLGHIAFSLCRYITNFEAVVPDDHKKTMELTIYMLIPAGKAAEIAREHVNSPVEWEAGMRFAETILRKLLEH